MSSENPVQIREAVFSDAMELARLRWDSRVEDQSSQPRTEFFDAYEAWFREALESGRWVMAVAAGPASLCGCMFLQCVEKVPAPGATHREWGYVTNSFVDSSYRGQGIGQQLLKLLIETAQKRGLEFLIVWPSEAAVEFYRSAGFQRVSEVHSGPDDEPPLELPLPT